ncbi:MAG TPA: hypothetical protein VGA69_04885 [Nitriliruptorales bacterium]
MRFTSGWPRRYAPLSSALIATLLAIFVLPSALNVPQSNPSQTLEFAPVPPAVDDPPPPDAGNVETLSLGMSASVTGDAPGGDGPGQQPVALPPPGVGDNPITKRCVGRPPRQTDDPLAPPCVAFFEGDNGGSTTKGVTGDEVRILILQDGGFGRCCTAKATSTQSTETAPVDTCYDLVADPYDEDEHSFVTALRDWQYYFNDRYQTYGRQVRFIVCYAGTTATPESRRADAAQYNERFDPFANFLQFTDWGYGYDFYDAMAHHGVMSFPRVPPGIEMLQRNQPLMWAFESHTQRDAELYASAVCRTIAPYPVSFSGNLDHGQPRKYGLIWTTDPVAERLRQMKDLIVSHLEDCGVQIADQATHPSTGFYVDNRNQPDYAQEAMSRFQNQGITTILWAGGNETNFSKAAAALQYRPEWVVASDRSNDGYYTAQYQDHTVWRHAWVITTQLRTDWHARGTPCHDAYRSVRPEARDSGTGGLEIIYACAFYEQLRQLFTAIQVAGPKLSPQAIDKGFRAIPRHTSSDPRIPACFYEPGDWTCVQDATAMWWDPVGVIQGESKPGCWRPAQGGLRYLAWEWPEADLPTLKRDTDPCNAEGRNLTPRWS